MSTPNTSPDAAARLRELRPIAGRAAGIAVLAAAIGGLLAIATARLVATLVDRIVFSAAPVAALAPLLAAAAAVAVGRAVATWASERAGFEAAAAVRRRLLRQVLDHAARLGPVRLADRPLGDRAAALTEAIDAVAPLWRSWRPATARAVVVPVGVLAVVFPGDPLAATILVVALPLLVWFSILAGQGAEEANRRQWASLSRLGGHLLDQIRGLGETKLAGTSGRAIASVRAAAEAYGRETMAVLRLAFLSALVLEFVATGAIAGVAMAVGFRLLWGTLDFSTGFFVLLLAPEFFAPLRDVGVRRHGRIEALAALDTIGAFLDEVPPARIDGRRPAPAAAPGLRFEAVRVVHGDGRVALDGFDLAVAPGEHVAIVGPSGAGKSTVFALLARFLDPTEGRILVDGEALGGFDAAAWRGAIVHLPQAPPFFEGTVADNVALGRAPADGDRAATLRRALVAAGAAGFVDALPQGAETPLGEGGRDLSGGEAQRLALARAFWAPGPLVLFDEPTAHLDGATQETVGRAIAALRVGRTMLTIAHRLETVARADRVVVIEHGRVVAAGSPAEMLAAGGGWAPTDRREGAG